MLNRAIQRFGSYVDPDLPGGWNEEPGWHCVSAHNDGGHHGSQVHAFKAQV